MLCWYSRAKQNSLLCVTATKMTGRTHLKCFLFPFIEPAVFGRGSYSVMYLNNNNNNNVKQIDGLVDYTEPVRKKKTS